MTPLLVRSQSGERAFERLYQAHVRDIYRYALMVTRNPEDAEDVVQTTFLKAFRAFEAGERPRNGRHWLIKIAHNTCRTRIRDARRRPLEVSLEERMTEAAPLPEQDGVQPIELLRALGDLTFNQRAALVMRELEGRTYAEIAQVLELSPSAVETLLFRARRALREQLDGSLECGEAEHALSRDLDGRLDKNERVQLRAHLRTCRECAGLARRQRARRAALGALGPLPLPSSLASWGGGAAVGTSVAVKVAAVVAAGAAAVGVSHEAADAVSAPAAQDRAAVVERATAAPTPSHAAPLAAVGVRGAPRSVRAALRTDVRSPAVAAPAVPAAPRAATQPQVPAPQPGVGSSLVENVATVATSQLPAPVKVPVEAPAVPDVEVPAAPPVPLPVEPPPLPELPPVPPVLP
jgi:RNA polymerase sigma factor (sigma-70 family)